MRKNGKGKEENEKWKSKKHLKTENLFYQVKS